ncbi:WRKY transcription factor 55 [Platanthera guangdongensis]|uniref:WRKY transcription factor 55 n=1 Tax=Platanthera guangdongensis TaxID=2320717 RepID=A0ABR2LYK3_9ASPA
MASRPCSRSSVAIDHLTGGYERLTQLRALLSSPPANLSSTAAQTMMISLLDKSLTCLAAALAELQSRSPITDAAVSDSKSETNPCKRMRGRGKGRGKGMKKMSWTINTTVSDFDGHTWRKYGQKQIEGAEFPRTYFKCTYTDDRGCPAKKTVQRKQDDSIIPKYEVCYIMQHTCKAMETNCIPIEMDSSGDTNRSKTSSPNWSNEQSISEGRAASHDLSPTPLPLRVEDMLDENGDGGESWSIEFSLLGELDFELDWLMSSSCNGEFDDS